MKITPLIKAFFMISSLIFINNSYADETSVTFPISIENKSSSFPIRVNDKSTEFSQETRVTIPMEGTETFSAVLPSEKSTPWINFIYTYKHTDDGSFKLNMPIKTTTKTASIESCSISSDQLMPHYDDYGSCIKAYCKKKSDKSIEIEYEPAECPKKF